MAIQIKTCNALVWHIHLKTGISDRVNYCMQSINVSKKLNNYFVDTKNFCAEGLDT